MKNSNIDPIDVSRPSLQLPSNDNQQHPLAVENLGQQQPLTIFYNGQVCVANVTDLQARTILYLARREMEARAKNPDGSEPEPPSPSLQPCQAYSPNSAFSMKKSLQRFLQERKNRIHSTSPNH